MKNGYLSVCYHYIRPVTNDPFPRIFGNREDIFNKHVEALKDEYQTISLAEAIDFSYGNFNFQKGKYGLLFTFDDGLSDHYVAAKILADHNIKAVFFIPTCILSDGMPINPSIIHYSLAHYGINEFLRVYENALEEYNINFNDYHVNFNKAHDSFQETIFKIKSIFKYKLKYVDSRKILLFIYKNLFAKDFLDAMSIIHLTKKQIIEILAMGHSIGAHSHSHISIAGIELSNKDFEKEVVFPKGYLENTFKTSVDAFSYPFGEERDYNDSQELIKKTKIYKAAYTVSNFLNTKEVPKFALGRHTVRSSDGAEKLSTDLKAMLQ